MLDLETTVAAVVLEHSECAEVFHRHRIDFCCKGGRSIAEASRDRGIDATALMDEIARAIHLRSHEPVPVDPRALETRALIDYIVATHHAFLRTSLPFVKTLADKVARVHGDRDERLVSLAVLVGALADTLLAHLDEEENELFPLLSADARDPVTVASWLESMLVEHEGVGELLGRIRMTSGDYRTPSWACTSYRNHFAELEQIERDVLVHVHLENYVLRPRFVGN
jgi:regulator of cell morphogenesis and NO signaling